MLKTKENILKEASEKNVKFIRLQFTDLFGNLKNVEIPKSQLEKALNNEMMFDGSSIEGFTRIEESDMYLRPDYDSWLVLPEQLEGGSSVARLMCDVYMPDGTPFEGDPRSILKKVVEEAKAMGFDKVNVGPEPEFFLFKKDKNNQPTLELNDRAGYFDLSPIDEGETCRREIVTTLEEMGFEMEAAHHEVAQGQHEIDFKYDEIIRTADNIQIFKLVVKNIAKKYGLHATFMPKPKHGISGSGMHCHMSLFQDGKNTFYHPETKDKLSKTAKFFIAGILKHAKANAAITNPVINSYKRIVPGYEAPVNIAWSTSNRSCMIRIPASRGIGTRVEVRNPDPTTNPYLALAVLLKAGLEGIKNKLDAPPETKGNIYEMSEMEKKELGLETLPENLKEALEHLQKDKVITSTLGNHAISHYITGKTIEWNMYKTKVTDWELEQYFNL